MAEEKESRPRRKYKLRLLPVVLLVPCIIYFDILMANLVTYQQVLMVQSGSSVNPLPDVLFDSVVPTYGIEDTLGTSLRMSARIISAVYVVVSLLMWAILARHKPKPMAQFLVHQIFTISLYSLFQVLTVTPDPNEACLDQAGVDAEGSQFFWIFYRFSIHTCGTTISSNDLAQVIIATRFLDMTFKRGCPCRCARWLGSRLTRVLGALVILTVMSLLMAARTQYTRDLLIVMVLTVMVVTHPRLSQVARLFVKEDGIESKYDRLDTLDTDRESLKLRVEEIRARREKRKLERQLREENEQLELIQKNDPLV